MALLSAPFVLAAMLAGSSLAIAAGLAGYFVVVRRLSFASDALSHVAFTGALAGAAFGLSPLLGLFGLSVALAPALGGASQSSRQRDEATGTALAWTMGVGALFLTVLSSSANSSAALGLRLLFGSALSLSLGQAVIVTVLAGGIVLATLAMARPLLFASLDPLAAQARGVPVRLLSYAFLLLLGFTVAEAIQAVGALLIFALLIAPAATAMRLTSQPYRALALSAALSFVLFWCALISALLLPLPLSGLLALYAAVLYTAAHLLAGRARVRT
jgi:zinc/manganese transport system permease protein